ncbi:uncharacterized protein LOC120797526 [Xiphias gladius]|uniref:uncharacterized protein LOC120797526 n=1 Tax=Xiphias gladius TaxID=8245 RepID=UPI001A9A0686|nr:uncharacterized protein LOC120797526 [Xiphias gladius]
MNVSLVTALLCTFSWISASVSEFHTVEVQSGEEVTLLCTNFSAIVSHISWFRLGNEPSASCISSMFSSDSSASFCDGFCNERFNMTSNTTTIFLKIKHVDLSDSGLYLCGFRRNSNPRELPVFYSATYLKVHEESDELTNPTSVILGGLIIFLIIVVIVLVFKIRKRHTAHKGGQNPQPSENVGTEDLNYVALSFHPKPKRNLKTASERELEPNVVYAATR